MVRKAAFTICAPNYLARAAVLLAGVARHLPDHEPVLVLAADRLPVRMPPSLPADCRVLTAGEIGARRLGLRRLVYDVTEFCTSIKPDVFAHLFRGGCDEVLYFDPDILLTSPLPELDAAWRDGADIVLTPHVVSTRRHPEWVMGAVGLSGQFNLGFLGLRRTATARRMLGWWGEEVALGCIADPARGRFVDQKVADFVVGLFPGYRAIRHPGWNVAYWNLHERPLTAGAAGGPPLAAGRPLRFFHFSGFSVFRARLSRHLGHFAGSIDDGPALHGLMKSYADALLAQGELAFANLPYDLDRPRARAAPDGMAPEGMHLDGIATSRALRRGLLAAATASTDGDDLWPADSRIDLETLTAPVSRSDGRRLRRPVPRFLALLLAGGALSDAAHKLVAAWVAADATARPAAMAAMLEALHGEAAVDPRIAERLVAIDDPAPPDSRLPPRLPPGSLAAPCAFAVEDGTATVRLPALLLLLHRLRPDLAARFPLDRWRGVVGYVAWFLVEGHALHAYPPGLLEEVLAAADHPIERHDGADVDPPAGSTPFSAAMCGATDGIAPAPTAEVAVALQLLDADPEAPDAGRRRIARAWLWAKDAGGVPRIVRLHRGSAALRRRLPEAAAGRRIALERFDAALASFGLARAPGPAVRTSAIGDARPVVVVGPFAGVSGVGVSAAGIVARLAGEGRPVETVDLFGDAAAAGGPDRPPGFALFHANADIAFDVVVKFHAAWAAADRRVAYWAWELPCMTARMAATARLFDEIWVPTEFVRRAVAAGTDVPVRVVPPAIDRTAFLPGDPAGGSFARSRRGFRFLGVADARSYLARKNPQGAIRAFRMAFPGGDEPAELVVKLAHGHRAPAEVARLHEMAAGDARIRLLDGVLPAAEMNDLYQSADCVVSLHRSEGHGLVLVQAMAMGKPVIATAWSGPMDFLAGPGAFLVPWTPAPVPRDAYPDWLGQTWAEPDLQAAALFMREVATSRATVTLPAGTNSLPVGIPDNGNVMPDRLRRAI